MARANVNVDGFNLYGGALYRTTVCKWLNLRALSQQLFPDLNIQTIKYFTAEIAANPGDPGASGRQRVYWRALRTDPDLHIIKGRFFRSNKLKPLAKPLPKGNCTESDCPKGSTKAEVIILEEKMSDVNLATHLLTDGFLGSYDAAIVITNDTDLCEPIRVVRDVIQKEVMVVRPVSSPGRKPVTGLAQVASKVKDIDRRRLPLIRSSQFPDQMQDAKGTFQKPASW